MLGMQLGGSLEYSGSSQENAETEASRPPDSSVIATGRAFFALSAMKYFCSACSVSVLGYL
jgi:hypothetical protein